MGDFNKDQNQGKQIDKSAFQQLGDDKGEGGQQDIKTDSVASGQGKQEEFAGAQGQSATGQTQGQNFGDKGQQEQQDFAKGGQGASGDQFGEKKGQDYETGKDENQQR